MIRCATCGAENPPDNRFCETCGTVLATPCLNCGAPVPRSARFCGRCGTPVGEPAAAVDAGGTVRPGPTAERRLVSILFADLVGFTTLAEARDPEEVREILSDYFERSREVVVRHGGVVEKFIGDAVMAVWGSPVAHEDDAERAARSGL